MVEILKFYAPWCGPCKVVSEHIKRCSEQFTLTEVNLDTDPEEAEIYGVRSIPTLVFLKDGVAREWLTGKVSAAAIDDMVRKLK